jgi:hypothetical protein
VARPATAAAAAAAAQREAEMMGIFCRLPMYGGYAYGYCGSPVVLSNADYGKWLSSLYHAAYRVGFCIVYIMTCIYVYALWVTSVASDDDDDDDDDYDNDDLSARCD